MSKPSYFDYLSPSSQLLEIQSMDKSQCCREKKMKMKYIKWYGYTIQKRCTVHTTVNTIRFTAIGTMHAFMRAVSLNSCGVFLQDFANEGMFFRFIQQVHWQFNGWLWSSQWQLEISAFLIKMSYSNYNWSWILNTLIIKSDITQSSES